MQLITVLLDGRRHAAKLEGDEVQVNARPGGVDALLADGFTAIGGPWIARSEAIFDAPLRPPVVLCVGQNYYDHLKEKAAIYRPEPEFFLKAGQTIAAPGDPAVLDRRITKKLDYETELGVVIGRGGRRIAPDSALEHVAGYVVLNDLTARDRQIVINPDDGRQHTAIGPGKNFEGSTHMGPVFVTCDELPDPTDLELRTTVNGELRQHNTTANLITPIEEIIAFLSTLLTLQPGTVVATGTPGGTGWGMDVDLGGTGRTPAGCSPARYLEPGDHVIGTIGNVLRYDMHVVGD